MSFSNSFAAFLPQAFTPSFVSAPPPRPKPSLPHQPVRNHSSQPHNSLHSSHSYNRPPYSSQPYDSFQQGHSPAKSNVSFVADRNSRPFRRTGDLVAAPSHRVTSNSVPPFAPTASQWKQCCNGTYNVVQTSSAQHGTDSVLFQCIPTGAPSFVWVHPNPNRPLLREYRLPTQNTPNEEQNMFRGTYPLRYQNMEIDPRLQSLFSNWVFVLVGTEPSRGMGAGMGEGTAGCLQHRVIVDILKWTPIRDPAGTGGAWTATLVPVRPTFHESLAHFYETLREQDMEPGTLPFGPFRFSFAPMWVQKTDQGVDWAAITASIPMESLCVIQRGNSAAARVIECHWTSSTLKKVSSAGAVENVVKNNAEVEVAETRQVQEDTPRPVLRFKITAELQPDVYSLWVYHPKNRLVEKWGSAYVSDLGTSQQLNRLFRRIREMDCLDCIEESDDECDFEDARPDKYVNLSIAYTVLCEWVPYCNKWKPIRIEEATIYEPRRTQIVSAPAVCTAIKQNMHLQKKQFYVAVSHKKTHYKLKAHKTHCR